MYEKVGIIFILCLFLFFIINIIKSWFFGYVGFEGDISYFLVM